MYIPSHYKNNDLSFAVQLIKDYSFGLLTCNGKETPMATHLPFICKEKDEQLVLYTHLAKANPQSAVIAGNSALVVFTGPHTYISATWYANKRNVPTWNYAAVHIGGTPIHISDPEKVQELLRETIAFYEKGNTEHHMQLPAEYKQALAGEITFLEIVAERIEIKTKFNQNKPKEDLESVIRNLTESDRHDNIVMAEFIKKFNAKKLG